MMICSRLPATIWTIGQKAAVIKWRKLAQKLGLMKNEIGEMGDRVCGGGDAGEDLLVHGEQPALTALPLSIGVTLASVDDHYEYCDAVPALEAKQKFKQLEVDRFPIELKRQAVVR